MEEKVSIKSLELNIKSLENFDKIMSTKLDEIDELKITSLDNKSKLLNIISLCSKVKTLIIQGDLRLNSDKILTNIFRPELVENLIFDGIKIPSSKSLKKYKNIKRLTLKNIRLCNVSEIINGLPNIELIESIAIVNSDMMNSKMEEFEKFSGLNELILDNVINCELGKISFLKKIDKISNLEIKNNIISIEGINNLLKCRANKNIDLEILDINGKKIDNASLIINNNECKLLIPVEMVEEISKNVNLYKIDKISLMISSYSDDFKYIKHLKKYKKYIDFTIKNFSALTLEQAKKMKSTLKLQKINVKNENSIKEYDIDIYIEIRSEINKILSNISKNVSQPEKFLEIYKYLGKEFIVNDEENSDLKSKLCTSKQVASLLQNCLQCMDINSNIITGKDELNGKESVWNQVQIDGKWYNVDLALDMENIKKKKAEYCLLGDENFLQTHTPKSGKNNYCPEDFNPKLVNVFIKTGLYKENLIQSYFTITLEKFKKMLQISPKEKMLLLPEGKDEKLD